MPPSTAVNNETISTLTIRQEIDIIAPIEIAWEAVLEQMGPKSEMPDGKPFPFKLEAWPGGRLFRDMGNSTGHLWGHVQVIKPPKLLEIWGPMMMSYPAVNHLQYRLTAEGKTTRLQLTHRAMGVIEEEHRDGMPKGFEFWVQRMKHLAESKANKR
jgi:uncharacterized protein YndB with AHSA1/START domain